MVSFYSVYIFKFLNLRICRFDKTFTMVVFKNGIYGANVEHAWADAPIFGHLMEEVFYHEFRRRKYKEDGSCDADKARLPFKPEKLKWDIDSDCLEIIQKSKKLALGIADDVDMYIMPFGATRGAEGAFGKRVIKKCGVSPDAFVQDRVKNLFNLSNFNKGLCKLVPTY